MRQVVTEKLNNKEVVIGRLFWSLVVLFMVMGGLILSRVSLGKFFLVPLGLLGLTGLFLLVSTLKSSVGGWLRRYLLMASGGTVGFFVFAVLHNLVYGLMIYWRGVDYWSSTGSGDEPFFFLLAVIVCPIIMLVGIIGAGVLLIKQWVDRR